jgi:outer membrane protein assembly factor BamA
MTRFWRAVVFGLVVGVLGIGGQPTVHAQSSSPDTLRQRSVAAMDSTRPANQTPYRSNRTVVEHALALPAYVLHGVTRPIGWVGRWGAENLLPVYRRYFTGPRAVVPVLTLGGETAAAGGFLAYDRHLFGSDHSARVRAKWGSRNVNDFSASYTLPRPLGNGTSLSLSAQYFNDPSKRFFLRENQADQRDEARFSLEQFQVSARLDYDLGSLLGSHLTVEIEDATTEPSEVDEERGDRLPPTLPGLGDSERLQVQTGLTIDGTREGPRAMSGTRLNLGLRYNHELGDDRFRYGGYAVEVQQFVPILILPETRRLALRARLQQSESLGGDRDIPFHELSRLGSENTLRGFENERFSDEGFLLFGAEYRYPVWGNMDALLFTEAGQVFGGLGEIPENRFHPSGGVGIHLLGGQGPRFRFEVAFSQENTRIILTAGPAF